MKVMSAWALFELLLLSTVIYKQRILNENEIVQYVQNYKYKGINQDHSKKHYQTSTNAMKNNYPETAHSSKGIFGNDLTANGCHNIKICDIVKIWKKLKNASFFHKFFVKSYFKIGTMKK